MWKLPVGWMPEKMRFMAAAACLLRVRKKEPTYERPMRPRSRAGSLSAASRRLTAEAALEVAEIGSAEQEREDREGGQSAADEAAQRGEPQPRNLREIRRQQPL